MTNLTRQSGKRSFDSLVRKKERERERKREKGRKKGKKERGTRIKMKMENGNGK